MSTSAQARFAKIVLPLLDEAYRLARWLTGSSSDAEDVLQDACLRAYNSIDRYVDANSRAWFLTIVRHASYTWMRKHRSENTMFIDDLDPALRAEIETGNLHAKLSHSPEDALIAKNDIERIRAAVGALPLALREIIVLREYHGFSYREIAQIADIPMGTVMSRLASARKTLSAMYKEGDV